MAYVVVMWTCTQVVIQEVAAVGSILAGSGETVVDHVLLGVITNGTSESWGTGTSKCVRRVAACSTIETRAGATHIQIILTIPSLYIQCKGICTNYTMYKCDNSYINF